MSFTSIVDIYFVSIGLLSYNILYSVLFDTGLIYFPFAFVIFSDLTDAISSGRTSSLQRKIEVKFFVMLISLSLTFIPLIDYKISDVATYSRMCEIDGSKKYFDEEPMGYSTSDIRNVLVNVSGYDLKIPPLLGLVYNLGNGVSLEAINRLPCSINITAFNQAMLDASISDPHLVLETKSFLNTCYYPAKTLAIRNRDSSVAWIDDPDGDEQPWAGAKSFLNNNYYGNIAEGFYSKTLLEGFTKSPNNKNVSAWESNPSVQALGGFPTCREWWNGLGDGFSGYFSGGDEGLRKRLISDLIKSEGDDTVRTYYNFSAISAFKVDTRREQEDAILKAAFFNGYNISSIEGIEKAVDYSDRSDGDLAIINEVASRAAGTYGMVKSAFPSYAGASMIQLAAPILKAIILMVLIGLAPLGSLASNYGFKFIVPFYFFMFSVLMWPYLFELSLLAQQSFVDEVLGEGANMDIVTNPNVALIGTSLTDLLFVLFPGMLTAILTMAGLNLQSASSMSEKPGASEGSAAKNAGNAAQGAAKDGVKNGVEKAKAKRNAAKKAKGG
ncbi:MAG: conjugal transfer protein TraG N-terminal domain-containing protein [Flavobacteriales bacterium]|nr:conjugal transfer protein TraG N-terminal domain-containing protein [Flavobacteriales bacterium]